MSKIVSSSPSLPHPLQSHLDALYDTLLEQNLMRIIEPFSRVQVSHLLPELDLPKTALCGLCCHGDEWLHIFSLQVQHVADIINLSLVRVIMMMSL